MLMNANLYCIQSGIIRNNIGPICVNFPTRNNEVLCRLQQSVVRPVVEYACPVWHTNLPIYLSDNIEMIHKRGVRAIFPGMSYVDILNHINLSTLKERRDYLCKKYFINMQARSHKVNCLLPKKGLSTIICDMGICTH